jgi:hypothetical protein
LRFPGRQIGEATWIGDVHLRMRHFVRNPLDQLGQRFRAGDDA